ncbi:hypothetical protein LTS17_012596 [Exophiala oligosperma]
MDNIIFEDPFKARIRSKQHKHSHTSNVGHSEPLSLHNQTLKTPLYELCRSPLHDDTAGDGRILAETFLYDDFSLAQIDDDGLAESLDDDLDSLFCGVPPDLESFKTTCPLNILTVKLRATLHGSLRLATLSFPHQATIWEDQLHKSGFELGAPIGAGMHNSAHRSESEQTLIDRDADPDYEGMTGPDLTSIEPSPNPATRLNIDKPMDSHRELEQERHHDGLKIMSVHPVTATDAALMTAVIDSPAVLPDFFHSPAAWAFECGVHPDKLANIVLKPLADRCWLLTATISRPASNMDNLRQGRARRRRRCSPDPHSSSDFCPSECETLSRPTKRGHWTSDEDIHLTEWRRLGKPWSWIFDQFPERSEAAVRSRWFVVLAPRAKPT